MSKKKSSQPPAGYVVWYQERLRDGTEDGAKLFKTLAECLTFINKLANGFAADNMDFQIFELGPEVPINIKEEKTEQVTVKTRRVAQLLKVEE